MRLKGWGPVGCVLLAFAIALTGCASREAEERPPEAGDAAHLIGQGRYLEARRALQSVDSSARTPEQNVLLGESCLGLQDPQGAARAFYRASVQAGLSRALRYRLQSGLGDVCLAQRDGYGAETRFQEAQELATNRAERDRAAVGRARALLMRGKPVEARSVRRMVTMPGVVGLAALDAELAARDPQPDETAEGKSALVRRTPERNKLPGPPVISRARWRARPVVGGRVDRMRRITRLTVHHTAEKNPADLKSFERMAARMRGYQSTHVRDNHWGDIGYHYVIDKEGRIWEGRETRWLGAHAGSPTANVNNVGIALVGNFDREKLTWSQKKSLYNLLIWLSRSHRIPPSRMYTHDRIRRKEGPGGTRCPGRDLEEQFRQMKVRIGRELGAVAGSWKNIPEVRPSERPLVGPTRRGSRRGG